MFIDRWFKRVFHEPRSRLGRPGGLLVLCLISLPASALAGPPQAAIASAHPLATRAGFAVLAQGGNAFDAAVAVAATLAVVEPFSSGLGGGGFWLLRRGDTGRQIMLDSRETAPSAAHARMFLDGTGKPIEQLSLDGPLAAAIPGLPAALEHLTQRYGRLPLEWNLAAAIRHAERGFRVGERYARSAKARESALRRSDAAQAIFLQEGRAPRPGFRLVQRDLAETLRQIAAQGRAGFYVGKIARQLVSGVRAAGGNWSLEDLRNYRVLERQPILGEYNTIKVASTAPPSSGGIVLLEALNMLSAYPLNRMDAISERHLVVEALRRAYRDRDLYLGDPAFVTIPTRQLLSLDYAAGLRATIRPDRALPSDYLFGARDAYTPSENTTHFSIVDREGNAVAATLSINYAFGSGFVPPGTGVLLNDEMDDFAVSPGRPNLYGLVGGGANAIAPGKRMLSSMSPTILESQDRLAVLGTPGGSRIVSMVLLAVLDFARGRGPHAWVAAKRFHHQYQPDVVEYEPGALSPEELRGMEKLGHRLRETRFPYGDMQAVLWDKAGNRISAASDPRGEGAAYTE
jgi:gamma-glutamyltranspeptidase/glutathione hydrolase